MELPTPQLETLIALNNFLQKWKQDPASQYNLNIASQNVLLWDPLDAGRNLDLMPLLDQPIEIDFDEFLLPEDIEDSIEPVSTLRPDIETTKDSAISFMTDLSQVIRPTTRSITNPFIGGTWKTQVNQMLTQLATKGRTRKDINQKIQTYYYLGKLWTNHEDPGIIKDFIEKKQGKRKAKDTWLGAYRTYELFGICPKEVIPQLQTISAT